MKRALSIILAAVVTLSFAGLVLAEEPSKLPPGHPPLKADAKQAKKEKKAKKAKKAEKKDEAKPTAVPAAK